MANALDKLADVVRRAEARAVSERLDADLREAAERLKAAEETNRAAQQRLLQTRKERVPQIEKARAQEQQVKELVQKAARFKSHLDDGQIEDLISEAQREYKTLMADAEEALRSAEEQAGQAGSELRAAVERYQELRSEVDRLQPEVGEDYAGEDAILKEAETWFPAGQLRTLEQEIADSETHYGLLTKSEQYHQMEIWIGRLRRLQAMDLSPEEHARSRRLYGTLVGISKTYEPGYIDAFRQDFHTDWDIFVAEAQERLQQATDMGRRKKELERQQREQQQRREEERRAAREEAQATMEELKAVIARFELPEQGQVEFRQALANVKGFAASDPDLLDLITPYRELLEGQEFRPLRRNIERRLEEGNGSPQPSGEEIADLLDVTRGKRAVMIGGSRREDVRRQLEQLFEFGRLEWEDYEDTKPAKLKSLEQRVRSQGMDLMLILKSFVRHHIPEKLRPLCEQNDVPCLMVEQGYGAAQVAEALRRGIERLKE